MIKTLNQIPGVVVAVLDGVDPAGRPVARWDKTAKEPKPVRTVWMENELNWNNCKGLRCILGFENGGEEHPILLGLLDRPPAAAETYREAQTEGERKPEILRIESGEELILECGEAKISLRADGRIVILGGYVLSRSKGVNKIKGGSVQIN